MHDPAALELLTRDAWPAAESVPLGDWRLRAHHGTTRRANSAWTAAAAPEGWQEAVEAFYQERGLPVRLQVGDATPAEADRALAAAGYVAEAPTSVLTACAADVLARTEGRAHPDLTSAVSTTVTPAWLDAYLTLEGFDESKREVYGEIFGRLAGGFVLMRAADHPEPVAVALGVAQGEWIGLSCLVVAESHRGRGLAGATIRTLAGAAPKSSIWLQVMDDNAPALGLYGKLGFTRAYGYHYRTLVH